MANTLDQNAQQATTSPKKVWKKPEVYIIDRNIEGGGTNNRAVEKESGKLSFTSVGLRGPYGTSTFNRYHS